MQQNGAFLVSGPWLRLAAAAGPVAALANQVFCSVRALSTFGNLVLPNDLAVAHAKLLCSSLDAVDMRSSVAFRLVANRDNANLQVAGSCI